jgi:hypothetical protein
MDSKAPLETMTEIDSEASLEATKIVSGNDTTSGTKAPASCMCVKGHRRQRMQGIAGGLCVALVGLVGLVVGLCWYSLGPSDITCTGGSVVACTRRVVDGMSIFPSAWQAVIAVVSGIASARISERHFDSMKFEYSNIRCRVIDSSSHASP